MSEAATAVRGHPSLWTALVLVGPLALLAEALIRFTHHRPLGAATFACGAALAWMVLEVFSRRVLDTTIHPERKGARRIIGIGGAALSAAVLLRALLSWAA
jgi:hypothetical protein